MNWELTDDGQYYVFNGTVRIAEGPANCEFALDPNNPGYQLVMTLPRGEPNIPALVEEPLFNFYPRRKLPCPTTSPG